MWIACSWIFCDWNHFEFGQMWLEDHSLCSVPNKCFTRNETAPPCGCLCLQRSDLTPISPRFLSFFQIFRTIHQRKETNDWIQVDFQRWSELKILSTGTCGNLSWPRISLHVKLDGHWQTTINSQSLKSFISLTWKLLIWVYRL